MVIEVGRAIGWPGCLDDRAVFIFADHPPDDLSVSFALTLVGQIGLLGLVDCV